MSSLLPTPTSVDYKSRGPNSKQLGLDNLMKLLPTPNTLDAMEPKPLDKILDYNHKARPGRSYASMNLRETIAYGQVDLEGKPLTSLQEDFHVLSKELLCSLNTDIDPSKMFLLEIMSLPTKGDGEKLQASCTEKMLLSGDWTLKVCKDLLQQTNIRSLQEKESAHGKKLQENTKENLVNQHGLNQEVLIETISFLRFCQKENERISPQNFGGLWEDILQMGGELKEYGTKKQTEKTTKERIVEELLSAVQEMNQENCQTELLKQDFMFQSVPKEQPTSSTSSTMSCINSLNSLDIEHLENCFQDGYLNSMKTDLKPCLKDICQVMDISKKQEKEGQQQLVKPLLTVLLCCPSVYLESLHLLENAKCLLIPKLKEEKLDKGISMLFTSLCATVVPLSKVIMDGNRFAVPNLVAMEQSLILQFRKMNHMLQKGRLSTTASLSAPLVEKKEGEMIAISGQKCSELLRSSNLDGLLEKMSLALLTCRTWGSRMVKLEWKVKPILKERKTVEYQQMEFFTESSTISKTVDIPSKYLLCQLAVSVLHIEEIGSGLLGTPRAQERPRSEKFLEEKKGIKRVPTPSEAINKINQRLLRTPSAQEPGIMVERLQTKDGQPMKIGERAYDKKTGRLAQVGLTQQIAMLPTPQQRDYKGPQGRAYRQGAMDLPAQIQMLPTPSTGDVNRSRGGLEYHKRILEGNHTRQVATVVGTNPGLKLQPNFVAWMMGYPQNWGNLNCRQAATELNK